MQIVEQENVDAAVERASRCTHIRFDGSVPPAGINRRWIGRSISENAEGVCGLPSSRDLEVVFRQVPQNAPAWIRDDGVDLDEVGLGSEGDRGLEPQAAALAPRAAHMRSPKGQGSNPRDAPSVNLASGLPAMRTERTNRSDHPASDERQHGLDSFQSSVWACSR